MCVSRMMRVIAEEVSHHQPACDRRIVQDSACLFFAFDLARSKDLPLSAIRVYGLRWEVGQYGIS